MLRRGDLAFSGGESIALLGGDILLQAAHEDLVRGAVLPRSHRAEADHSPSLPDPAFCTATLSSPHSPRKDGTRKGANTDTGHNKLMEWTGRLRGCVKYRTHPAQYSYSRMLDRGAASVNLVDIVAAPLHHFANLGSRKGLRAKRGAA